MPTPTQYEAIIADMMKFPRDPVNPPRYLFIMDRTLVTAHDKPNVPDANILAPITNRDLADGFNAKTWCAIATRLRSAIADGRLPE